MPSIRGALFFHHLHKRGMSRYATLVIFLISGLLLAINKMESPRYFKKVDPLKTQFEKKLGPTFKNREERSLLIAYTYGGSDGISREMKKAHRDLGLLHLFTPSGVHLSAILVPLLFLIRLVTKQKRIQTILKILIFVAPLFLSGFFCLKRMGVWRVLLTLFPLGNLTSFFLTFGGDYLFGSFSLEPLSFIYSFLFFGILLSLNGRAKILIPIALLFGQALVAFYLSAPFSILGLLLGMILTAIFAPLFPIFFLTLFFPILGSLSLPLLKFYLELIVNSYALIQNSSYIFSSIPLLLLIPLTFLPFKFQKKIPLILLLLLHSNPLPNLPWKDLTKKESIHSRYAIMPPIGNVTKSRIVGRSIYVSFNDDGKGRCTFRLLNGFYEKRCKYLKKRRAPNQRGFL